MGFKKAAYGHAQEHCVQYQLRVLEVHTLRFNADQPGLPCHSSSGIMLTARLKEAIRNLQYSAAYFNTFLDAPNSISSVGVAPPVDVHLSAVTVTAPFRVLNPVGVEPSIHQSCPSMSHNQLGAEDETVALRRLTER